jgi:hypothetical protein
LSAGISSVAAIRFFDCRYTLLRTAVATGFAISAVGGAGFCVAAAGCAMAAKGEIAANANESRIRFMSATSDEIQAAPA